MKKIQSDANIFLSMRYFIAILIAIFSFIHFIFIHNIEPLLSSPTAFEWPAVDMMVYFERALDPLFLPNDFFTNTSHDPSPRRIFGEFVIWLARIFHTDYYTIFFGMKAFLKITLPSILYLFLCSIKIGVENNRLKTAIKDIWIAPWAFFAGTWLAASIFSIANWRPLPIWAAPQSLGLFLSLLGAVFILSERKWLYVLGALSFFLGTLIHPAMGLFTAGFLIISSESIRTEMKVLCFGLISVLLATFILQKYYSDSYHLSNVEFIKNYVIEPYIHRRHYAPESFGAYGPWPWYTVVKMISGILILLFASSIVFKQKRLALLSIVYLAAYLAAIGTQIFFVKYFPSRTIAVLGPIRFTQFGYYMLAIVTSGVLSVISYKIIIAKNITFKKIACLTSSRIMLPGYLLIIALLTLSSFHWMDSPKQLLYQQHPQMYQWIQTHTKPTDTFAVPLSHSELFISIPIVAKRAVYYANAIAFSDRYLQENTARKNFIFGSYTEWKESGPEGYYCNTLTGARLKEAAKQYSLQWAIMPNECVDKRFSNLKIEFKDQSFTILRI